MAKHKNVTIVGGGFGGVKTALLLAKDPSRHITVISDRTYFQYYPSLFATATGHDYRQSWVPLTTIFKDTPNVTVINDTVERIDTNQKVLKGSLQSYPYHTAVLALGSVTTYFGIEGLDSFSFGIKSQKEIRQLQDHLWKEMSDGTDDEKHYVIIGAGPTGVELAGALGEYILRLRKHFSIKKKKITINLVEAAPRVLPRSSEATSQRALARLKQLGVHVELNCKVERQTATELIVNGKPLVTQTVIWTSGVANAPFYKDNESQFSQNERGKVNVDKHMKAAPHVYVIGDNANTPYAGLAQTALHDAIFLAKHFNGSKAPYRVKQQPSVVPIGENWAVFEWGPLQFGGTLGGVMRSLADFVGYHDVLPLGWAMKTWRIQNKKELRVPERIEE
jgi:NADH:ubiquinone reductase (H+-translocating)